MTNFIKTDGAYRVRGEVSEAEILSFAQSLIAEKFKRGDALTSPSMTHHYFMHRLAGYEHEVFACLFLDNQHRVIKFEEMFKGTINAANVYPREIVKMALSLNAAAMICVHNHPSGDTTPSESDKSLTKTLQDSLDLVDVRLLDHLIIGGGEYTSFAEKGLM
ncbi:RadC family protein [Thiomicrorhabdus indica]|uniref:RadC family protein n=1 Tax=Thiomicrorhabdus indica TaxID=2267253 RepID=UPI00102D9278|nr:DNA repair protein RadC [Thiomicrorhabdus indica]